MGPGLGAAHRLQPAVPKDSTAEPGRKWFSGFWATVLLPSAVTATSVGQPVIEHGAAPWSVSPIVPLTVPPATAVEIMVILSFTLLHG
jgi:hypothetical protein